MSRFEASSHQPDSNAAVRKLRTAMLVVVAALVAAAIIATDWTPDSFSPADNRKKAEAPTWNATRGGDAGLALVEYTGAIDSYVADRIGFRNELMAAYGLLNDKLFGVMTHPLYEYGKNGYVFFRFSNSTTSDDYLAAFAAYVREMQDYCEQRGIAFLYVLSPEKARIYPEEIPASVGEIPSTAATLKSYLDEYGVTYLDQADALLAAKESGQQVFNKVYDAGHWNTEGMYAGAQSILTRLQELGVDVDDIDLSSFHREYEQHGTLPASNYPIDEQTYKYYLIDPSEGTTEVEGFTDDLVMGNAYRSAWYYENEHHPNDVSVLMLQGSYYNTQGTMMHHQFNRFAMVHNYQNVFVLPYYVDVFEPDIVIFENADYTYYDQYYQTDYLATTSLPEPFDAVAELPLAKEGEGPTLRFDPSRPLANFSLDISSIEGGAEPQTSVYVMLGDRILDTVSNHDGIFWWGARTDELMDQKGAVVVVSCNGRQYWFACNLEGSLTWGDNPAEAGALTDSVAEDTWLGGARSVPFYSTSL